MKLGRLRQDDEGHWYLIPVEELEEIANLDIFFDNLFDKYRIDHPYNHNVIIKEQKWE